jgi:peptidoglycan/xylan/chitin deacetylase (PgdA/CDA1 family)
MVGYAKHALAAAFEATRLNHALLRVQRVLLNPFIRAVNYHVVPFEAANRFEEQLVFYARHFTPVAYDDVLALQSDHWPHDKPGILLSFDDGTRSHAQVVAPLLERYGFTGWFFIPAGLVVDGNAKQTAMASHAPSDPPMTWDEVRRLAGRHIIGCHTMTHRRLEARLGATDLTREVHEAKHLLEEKLGSPIPTFCWVGGEEWSYSADAARAVHDAGFVISFMTNSAPIRPGCDLLQLQRTNIEATYPMSLVKFQLSGFLDLYYVRKRRRVNALTAMPRESFSTHARTTPASPKRCEM